MSDSRPAASHLVGMAVVVLVFGAAGCARARPAAPDAPVYPPGPTTTHAADPTALSEAALKLAVRAAPYRNEQRLLYRAERELARRCMAARGYDYPIAGSGPAGAQEIEDDSWRPDLETRRRIGYGFGTAGPADGGRYPPGLPAAERTAYVRALSGDATLRATLRLSSGARFTFGTSGCIAKSRAELYGDVVDAARAAYVPQEAYNSIYPEIAADGAMRAAMRDWAACMTDRGHPYNSMSAARAAVGRAYDRVALLDAKRSFEIRVAVADAECALAAGLPKVAERVGRQHAAALPVERRRDLNHAAALRSDALRRARGVLR